MTIGAMELPPEGMLLGGVSLAGDPERGTSTTDGLSLLFTAEGITVQGRQPATERLLPWAGLDTATCRDQAQLPDGRSATSLVLTSRGQAIRFLLSPEAVSPGQAAYLDQAMPEWLARYRAPGAAATQPTPTQPGPAQPAAGAAAAGGALAGSDWAQRSNFVGAPGSGSPEAAGPPKKAIPRRTLVLLLVLVLVVVGAGAYLVAKRHNNSTTTAATPPATALVNPAATDRVLAKSIDLKLGDLPAGWTVRAASSTTPTSVPSSAAKAANTQAVAAFASCLGMSAAVIGPLFDGGTQPDSTASSNSPVFQSPTDPNVVMQSNTNVVKSRSDALADSVAFTKPNFPTCFQPYEAAALSSTLPGVTVVVTQVALTAPAGVHAYGYLSTLTVPGQGTLVQGDAFIIGGRIETTLTPTTHGSAVPSDAFSQAYNAIVGRVAAARLR